MALATVCLAARSAALAQRPPEGIEVGPWVLAPSFTTSYQTDSNIFLKSASNETPDQVVSYQGGLTATLPFRQSKLEFDVSASKDHFSQNQFQRSTSRVLGVDLELNLKTGDRIALRDAYRQDYARAQEIDAGGELTFNGEPYALNRWEIELSRTDPGRQGYVVRVRRQDFIYDGETSAGFFEYRGFDNSFEYRQPIPNQRSWIVRYDTRRFNHYDPAGAVGVPFRKEKTDSVQVGIRGLLGQDQPYRVHFGYGRFRYEGVQAGDFQGIVGTAVWRLRLGGRTTLDLEAVRRPLPSNFETYYINNGIRTELVREWLRFEAGTELEYTKNVYADDVVDFVGCDGRRKDDSYLADMHFRWLAHQRLRFEVSTYYKKRSSTCESSQYDSTGIETGLTIGWF